MRYLQRWISTLLLASTKLTSLSVRTDGVPWPPVLGLLPVRHLELTMHKARPWLDVIVADLRLASCLETLMIVDDLVCQGYVASDFPASSLPDLILHDVASLKSVDLVGWYPKEEFTLPQGCLLRLQFSVETGDDWEACAGWKLWQSNGCTKSMLHLEFQHTLQAWPTGVEGLSGLRFLELHFPELKDQDLAALQHIPHVCLEATHYSTFLLTSGSWQSLQIRGEAGFDVDFFSAEAFVKDTERFLFDCTIEEATEMYEELRAACMSQGVACHECEHDEHDRNTVAYLSNISFCIKGGVGDSHERLIHEAWGDIWPDRAAFPELYSCE